jgi:hypothetical protein
VDFCKRFHHLCEGGDVVPFSGFQLGKEQFGNELLTAFAEKCRFEILIL